MPSQLKHRFYLQIDNGSEVEVFPKGNFQIKLNRTGSYYRFVLEGAMTFTREDFNLIYYSFPDEPTFYISCEMKGSTWEGQFTKTDCEINSSHRRIDVTPRTNDAYDTLLPYMGLDFNILPEYEGVNSSKTVAMYRLVQREKKVVEITEEYLGSVHSSKTWRGYSVNDFITASGTGGYTPAASISNSLVRYLTTGLFPIPTTNSIDKNLLTWLDYSGYERRIAYESGTLTLTQTISWINAHVQRTDYKEPDQYTLTGVKNYFDSDGDFQRCELIYEREVYTGMGKPAFGGKIDYYSEIYYDIVVSGGSSEEELPEEISMYGNEGRVPRGWTYLITEGKWVRRPLGLGQVYSSGTPTVKARFFGDGYWFTNLSGFNETEEGFTTEQYLTANPNYATTTGLYNGEYGYVSFSRFHSITSIIDKYLAFVKKEGGGDFFLRSQYLKDTTSPLPYLTGETNEWRGVLVAQNTDAKKPEATERADKEIITMNGFMDLICGVMNAGWAISEGDLVIEHKYFFENGFSYDDQTEFLNPQSIINTALNKNFLRLSNKYRYDRPDMQAYEIFRMSGGAEPKFNNTKVKYSSNHVNNIPNQNIKEIVFDNAALDYQWAVDEGSESGLTFVYATESLGVYNVPFYLDSHNRYVVNGGFNLDYIVRQYHTYGRSFTTGEVNMQETSFITRPYILHDIFFPYRHENETFPYSRVVTELGYGIIREASLNTMTGIMQMVLGYTEGEVSGITIPSFADTTDKSSGVTTLQFHRHVQTDPSENWIINHRFGTDAIYKPLVFRQIDEDVDADGDFEEIGYNSLTKITENTLTLNFSDAVSGEVYLIAFDQEEPLIEFDTEDEDIDYEPATQWDIFHGLGVAEVHPSIIWQGDNEIGYDEFIQVDADNVTFKFNETVDGAKVYLSYVNLYEPIVTQSGSEYHAERYYSYPIKPLSMTIAGQINYDYSILEEYLHRIGFSETVVATIIVKEYD